MEDRIVEAVRKMGELVGIIIPKGARLAEVMKRVEAEKPKIAIALLRSTLYELASEDFKSPPKRGIDKNSPTHITDQYSAGPQKLKETIALSVEQAVEVYEKWKEAHKGMVVFMDKILAEAKEQDPRPLITKFKDQNIPPMFYGTALAGYENTEGIKLNMDRPTGNDLVGWHVKGFKFSYESEPSWIFDMHTCIGEIGTITEYQPEEPRMYYVSFEHDNWWFPAKEVEQRAFKVL